MFIKIKDCSNCPFANNDNEYGLDSCNLSVYLEADIPLGGNNIEEELPRKGIHRDCPISNELIFVR